ncbi:putative clathrin assembly protein At5g57200 isoform X2 [Magnolia sinica]|uniref:putative clathrin assembly protein At5g57200 isoform X2 n=1 Tax=Magnolia sinica TaxID=86752 RepID=UPI00265888C4|nr:putative clathrin assembly protein At5g57200 isoform X2 [Magnolia sinica]
MESWRKAYGALKDSTQVGLAKVNSEFKDLDIAIVKATNHSECPPKERYVRKIFTSTSVVRPRADVAYCIHALSRRLSKTRNWIVALKVLIVIHRTLREGDPTFREELLNYSQRGNILQLSNFKDDSSPLAWDCSAWVRTYALFLEERLECFRVLKYDIEAERLLKTAHGAPKGHCRTRDMGSAELLEQLPAFQQLLYRLIGCQPEGGAFYNYLIQYALALVLKESFKIYCAINDGIINLVDLFFDMSRYDAIKALNIYKRAGQQAESLADFYEFCKGLDLARNFQFPTLRLPPPSFLATMEEYIKEAPRPGSGSNMMVESQETNQLACKPQEAPPPEPVVEVDQTLAIVTEEPPQPEVEAAPELLPIIDIGDLLGLKETNPDVARLEESNALALAIVPAGNDSKSSTIDELMGSGTGWELALVTTPSSNSSHLTERELAGGFNMLLLDSLYEDEQARRQMNVGYGVSANTNLFDSRASFDPRDPFYMSNSVASPPNMQMAMMAQQQQQYYQQHMVPYQPQPYQHQQQYQTQYQQQYQTQHYSPHPQSQMAPAPNPFGDPFGGFTQIGPPQSNPNLL